MSWSISFIGKPENIVKSLEEQSTKLEGLSKTEFDSVLPNLIALVKQNYNKKMEPFIKLTASGHAYMDKDEPVYSSCIVSIEHLNGIIV